ncbi:atherin-like isoform X3 [Onychomys torridus]|uniref:atherin-like isoform X3 n=1 Tax=Onychomys torridus TaxID=38674 RepID=UPI00167F6063|nr:atherin-like isoform X3 [Onychomys torridus]
MHFGFASPLCLRVSSSRVFGRLWGWTLQWAVRGLEPLPQLHRGLPHPPPPPAPHPLHPARRTRAACSAAPRPGPAGRGNRAGQAATSPGSQSPAAENEWAGGAQGLDRGLRGAFSHLQPPGRPSWAPSPVCGLLLPPRGARRGPSGLPDASVRLAGFPIRG